MPDIDHHVLKVEGRNTRTGRTIFYVSLGDGNDYSTFDQALAGKAQALQGQVASARVSFKDQYKNLDDIAPQGGLPPMAMPAGTPVPMQGAVPVPMAVPPIPMAQNNGRGMDPERERKIVKQSVLATSFGFVGQLFTGAGPEALEEAKEVALALAQELFGQVFSAPQPAAPATPPEVAAQVNATIPDAVQVGAENVPQWA